MGLTIFTNIASLNAQRHLAKNNRALNQSFERLSSGLRINSAKDDAAGLAIAERMQSQVRGLNQAVRNSNDAISILRTAEGALVQTTQILQRLRELSVQAANDTYSTSDRNSLQSEADQLIVELDRIKDDTEFNDNTLLDGTFLGKVFQIGHEEGDTLTFDIGESSSFVLGAVAEVSTGANGATDVLGTPTATTGVDLDVNGVSIDPAVATDDNLSTADQELSALAKAAAINKQSGTTRVYAEVTAAAIDGNGTSVTADVDGFTFTINDINITVAAVVDDDSDFAMRDAINAVENQTGVRASVNAADELVLTADDGRNIVIVDTLAGAEFDAATGIAAGTYVGGVDLTSDESIIIAGTTPGVWGFTAGTTGVDSTEAVKDVVLTTAGAAASSITILDHAIRQVGSERSDLGSHMNRLDMTINVLSATSENTEAAKSQITDADFAAETAIFARNQIMQQAAAAMLAQANVSGQIALQLLGG